MLLFAAALAATDTAVVAQLDPAHPERQVMVQNAAALAVEFVYTEPTLDLVLPAGRGRRDRIQYQVAAGDVPVDRLLGEAKELGAEQVLVFRDGGPEGVEVVRRHARGLDERLGPVPWPTEESEAMLEAFQDALRATLEPVCDLPGQVTVSVVDRRGGTPVAGWRVEVPGVGMVDPGSDALRLPAGRHLARVLEAPGYAVTEVGFVVDEGLATAVEVRLDALATLTVLAPNGATVVAPGGRTLTVGRERRVELDIVPGRAVAVVAKKGGRSWSTRVTLEPAEERELRARLRAGG